MNEETHDDWSNWDTWNAYNWLGNDEVTYRMLRNLTHRPTQFRSVAEEALRSFLPDGSVVDDIDPDEVDWDEIIELFDEED